MLKRIRESLKRQDWTAVFIELMIVVLGVMIAFQVSEWSARNAERSREQSIISGLLEEFRYNEGLLNASMHDHERAIDHSRRLLEWTGPQPGDFQEATVDSLLFSLISELPTFNPRDGELNAVLSSGQLALIRNGEIRSRLAAWPGQVARLEAREEELRSDVFDVFYPYLLEKTPLMNLDYQVGHIAVGRRSRFPVAYSEMFKDVAFENHVENSWVLAEWNLQESEVLMETIKEMISLLEAELN